MEQFIYPREGFDEENLKIGEILKLIKKHSNKEVSRINRCLKYYDGQHEIIRKKKNDVSAPNNRIVCNHAKDITDTATGYFMANPITFTTKDTEANVDELTDVFDIAELDDVDQDNGLDMSKCGVAYEYVYAKENESVPLSKNLDARNCFIVIDDSIEERELFGVYYDRYYDEVGKKEVFRVTIGTETKIYEYVINCKGKEITAVKGTPKQHMFAGVPFIMYRNNKDCFGDFEQQLSLIDAYNTMMSDRVDDKEQFLKSILVIYGAILGDDDKESSAAMKALKEAGLLELANGTKAEYVTRTFDESGMEILRKAIKEDIYTFSHVPCLSDENFVGNSSGVAMEYKLLGMEMITKTKTRYYKKGLRKRIRLYCHYLGMKAIAINPNAIIPVFARGLPKNLLELSQMISNLSGKVSDKTLLQQLPFVDDPDGEIKEIKKQNDSAVKRQQELFSASPNVDEVEHEEKMIE